MAQYFHHRRLLKQVSYTGKPAVASETLLITLKKADPSLYIITELTQQHVAMFLQDAAGHI